MASHWGMPKDEIKMFENDKSGRQKMPLPGADIPQDQRHWYNHHQIYAEYLSSTKYTGILADTFYHFFSQRLDQQPLSEWAIVALFDLLKSDMAESAVKSMFGSRILELNPDLIKCYWEFDEVAGILVWGFPRFIRRRPWQIRERLHGMVHRHVESAWQNFDWNGPEAGSDWDPHWGSRFSREIAKWLRQSGFSNRTASGHTTATLFGLNGNTLPITAWILMELIKDPPLLRVVRAEVLQASTVDQATGEHRLDVHKLLSLPRFLSVYTEVLRMHISFNVTREVQQDIWIDGHRIAKGTLLQAPSQIAHYDESDWGVPGHPASEFWADRHLEYVNRLDEAGNAIRQPEFSMKARATSFFPYGGGYALCPGRHFAKREIMMAVAIILAKFDIEFAGWTHMDGSESDRPPQNDQRYAGAAAMPPDRDMKIRWKRLW
ncbi:hypothetical protein DL765_008234 [Monosporascus sp. GIB2]|nr:hypothetical protein DL765_008234 [Monosporascus sp. GIB2]